ncbi:MAG: hypothetical protein JW843_10200 [Candidatus Aminicenantes bacterium]|nr:hypothetical protein [Candidatus Aminicenantes bacterium]
MSDKKTARLVSELLKGGLSVGREARIRAALKKRGTDPLRLKEYERMWEALAEERVPEPSEAMRRRFRETLDEAKKTAWRTAPAEPAAGKRPARPGWGLIPRLAFGFSLVVIGWFVGYQLTPRPERSQIETLNAEMREMKTAVFLTKMESASAADRMSAVHYAEDSAAWNETVREALIRALNSDPNANVRLTALETLARKADDPRVREAFVLSIEHQESPLLFLALADVCLALDEKRAAEPFRKISADPALYFSVRQRLEETARKLM